MSRILATQCDNSKLSMAMDNMSYPHCVWVDGNNVKYARFCGDEWRIAGNTAIAMTSINSITISRNCVGFDDSWNPFFVVMDGQDMVLVTWNGITWIKETVWSGVGSIDPLAWSVAWAGFPVVVIITRSHSNKTIWAIDKSTGAWGTPEGESIPVQDNEEIELKIARVASWMYAFWNGKNESLDASWIGHAAWDTDSQSWIYMPNKKIAMSANEGEIGGIDFVTWDELVSSSSSD